MRRYIGLLRAVNLAGQNQVAMADLRDLLTQLGFADPRTLLQSGNVVFGSDSRRGSGLERLLEAEIERRLKVPTDLFVRTAEEWQDIIAGNPFQVEAQRDPGRLLVIVLKERVSAEAVQDLQASVTGPEVVHAGGKHIYAVYPNGVGRSRLTSSVIEKKLRTRGTGRNWNTILKLNALIRT